MSKMQHIADQIKNNHNLPYFHIDCSDSIMSSIIIKATLDPEDQWNFKIFHNAKYFIVRIMPANGQRYYENNANVTLELLSSKNMKLRKYTGTVQKVLDKFDKWVKEQQDLYLLGV